MFEAKPPRPADGFPLHRESWEDEALRELTWADLIARLAASRAMRGEFEGADEECEASFDSSCARRIAAHHHNEFAVNLEDSAYLNESRGIAQAAVNGTGPTPSPASRGSR